MGEDIVFVASPITGRARAAPLGAREARTSPARSPSSTSPRRRPSASSVEALDLLDRLVAVQHKLVLPLAAAASALNARSAWFTFGYRTREDFLRERFDRGGRWFRDLVRLQDHIGRLPGLSAALCGADGRAPIGQRAARSAHPRTMSGRDKEL